MNNHLTRLINKYPENPWEWACISYNPNITLDYMKLHEDNINWEWAVINPNIKLEDLSGKLLDDYLISQNPTLVIEKEKQLQSSLLNRLDKLTDDDWYNLSSNPNISLDFIRKNLDKPWNWDKLLYNPNITWESIKEFNKLDYWYLSCIPIVTWDIVKSSSNLGINWDFYLLSRNPNISWEIINENIFEPWDWFQLSKHPNITFEDILTNLDAPWNWSGVSLNPNLTCSIVEENSDIYHLWNWTYISCNQFNHHPYFQSETYRRKMTKIFHDKIVKELLKL